MDKNNYKYEFNMDINKNSGCSGKRTSAFFGILITLSDTEFVRVHRSYLVNVSKILRIELYEKQTQMLSLSNGDKLKISVSGYKRLREVLGL